MKVRRDAMQVMQEKKTKAIELLSKLADAEALEIEVDSKHVAASKNWVVRMFYDYGLADAKRHLEIATTVRGWLEQGKPPVGKIDVPTDTLEKEANSETGVASLVKQILSSVDDGDAKALLEGILADEGRHEQGLRALKQRALTKN